MKRLGTTAMRHIIALMSIMIMVACYSSTEGEGEGSVLKWGHLPFSETNGSSKWLIQTLPDEEIELCGERGFELLEKPIRKWAAPLERDKLLKIVPCGQGKKVRTKITLNLDVLDFYCTQGAMAYTDMSEGVISVCAGNEIGNGAMLLHEVGHAWGMCDTYPGSQNCDANNMTVLDNSSVMGYLDERLDLTQDDIDGIKAMANRQELAANKKAWDDFLAAQKNPTPTPAPTPAPTEPVPTLTDDIFLGLPEDGINLQPWIATSTAISFVYICKGNKATCTAPTSMVENLSFNIHSNSNPSRRYFRASILLAFEHYVGALTLLGYNSKNQIIAARELQIGKK